MKHAATLVAARPGCGRQLVARVPLGGARAWLGAAVRGEQVWSWRDAEREDGDRVATLQASYEGQTDGVTITTALSDDFGDTALAAVSPGTGGTQVYETSQAAHGTVSMLLTPGTTNTCYVQYTDGATSTSGALRIYLYLTGAPSTTMDFPIRFVSSANATVATIQMTTGRILRISAGSAVQGTVALALNTWHRIEVQYANITGGSGTVDCQSFTLDGTSPTDSIGLTGLTLTAIQGVRLGRLLASGSLAGFYFDDFKWVTGSATAIGPAGEDATPTPSAVARSVVAPAPTILTGSTLTPSAVSRAAVVPAPTVSTSITVQPTAVAAPVTMYPWAVFIDSLVDVTAVSRSAVIAAPTMSVGVTINPDTQAGRATSVGDPVLFNYLIATDADAADIAVGNHVTLRDSGDTLRETSVFVVTDKVSAFGFTNIFVDKDFQNIPVTGDYLQSAPTSMPSFVPEPTLTATATVATSVVAAVAAVPAPTVSGGIVTVSATAVARAVVQPAPTITAGATVTATVAAAVAAVPAPGVQAGTATTVSATAVSRAAAVPAPALLTDQTVTATAVARAAVVPAPTVQTGSSLTAVEVSAVATVGAPTIQTGSKATPVAVSSPSIHVPQPDLSTGHVVSATVASGVAAAPAPTLKMSADVTPVSVFGFASQVPVTVSAQASQTITGVVVHAVVAVPAPVPSMSTEPTGVAAVGTAAVPAPTIRCSATLNALFTVAAIGDVPNSRAVAKLAGGSLRPAGGVKLRKVPTLTGGVR